GQAAESSTPMRSRSSGPIPEESEVGWPDAESRSSVPRAVGAPARGLRRPSGMHPLVRTRFFWGFCPGTLRVAEVEAIVVTRLRYLNRNAAPVALPISTGGSRLQGALPEADLRRWGAKESSVRANPHGSCLPTLARFGLSSRSPTAARSASAASGEGFVNAIGSIIAETRAGLLPAALSFGIFATLLLTSP